MHVEGYGHKKSADRLGSTFLLYQIILAGHIYHQPDGLIQDHGLVGLEQKHFIIGQPQLITSVGGQLTVKIRIQPVEFHHVDSHYLHDSARVVLTRNIDYGSGGIHYSRVGFCLFFCQRGHTAVTFHDIMGGDEFLDMVP